MNVTFSKFRLAKLFTWPNTALAVLIIAAILVQSINVFGFPSYREDEGTYMSQAWTVIHLQRLTPYTYWYDHAPVGWFVIALWSLFFGNQAWSGILVNNGRVLMVILQIISTLLLYGIARRITKRPGVALLASILFAFSPINIVFHRQVLLDNVMVTWLLAALYAITKPITLRRAMLSAFFFGMAVLSKEAAAILLPWLVFLVARLAHPLNRRMVIAAWLSVTVLLISLYPLFALLKGELFPTGTLLGGSNPHVSLWDAVSFQWSRGNERNVTTETFWYAWNQTWGQYGAWLIILGTIATLYHLTRYRNPWLFTLGAMAGTLMVSILRGQILDWYIIALMPIFSLSIACMFGYWPHAPPVLKRLPALAQPVAIIGLILATTWSLWSNRYIFTVQQTRNQVDAVHWVKNNLLGKGLILTDNYAFMDLNPSFTSVSSAYAHYYWKVDTDPEIKHDILRNDWNQIDYLIITPAEVRTMNADQLSFVQKAYQNSHIIQWFRHDNTPPLAYPVEIREVNNSNGVIHQGWRAYRDAFITAEGRIIDRPEMYGTTSEAQSYALLRAVWENDQPTFDRLWQWTLQNMKRGNNNLFGWLYTGGRDNTPGSLQIATASDADEDIALALMFAAAQWQDSTYSNSAKKIIHDVWNHSVVEINSRYYLTSGGDNNPTGGYVINPSYLSPASYRVFATIDPSHPWRQLANDSYTLLNTLTSGETADSSRLVPNWIVLSSEGTILPASDSVSSDADLYGYDAFRVYWRVALDAVWFNNHEAKQFLRNARQIFKPEWEEHHMIAALYSVDGTPRVSYEDASTYAGALSVLYVTDVESSIDMYTTKIWPSYQQGFWGDSSNYYNQNWAWFATALYANNLPNLWSGGTTTAHAGGTR